ncbi:hypothetical protein [Kutzneria albida]|uniref:Plasmid replication, integration and excision activator n=1 Tax=Kutzneria albida DSM 43870 TaxID=1449976 RepID=W5W201_9PSEU|nr:hypothetical protein [Kutzneria albida]AHH94887.1 hypothetical protein KALB_1514 [Kutzneria albida DSM 43870]
MPAPQDVRFFVEFDEWFPQGLFLMGEITQVFEYQSQEDRAKGRPVRPMVDPVTGLNIYRGQCSDPAAEKAREQVVTVEFLAKVQPVPPAAVAPNVPVRAVVLEGMTVRPRPESSGQAKWLVYQVRATGLRGVQTGGGSSGRSRAGGESAGAEKSAA